MKAMAELSWQAASMPLWYHTGMSRQELCAIVTQEFCAIVAQQSSVHIRCAHTIGLGSRILGVENGF
jgi:hypothetical protein